MFDTTACATLKGHRVNASDRAQRRAPFGARLDALSRHVARAALGLAFALTSMTISAQSGESGGPASTVSARPPAASPSRIPPTDEFRRQAIEASVGPSSGPPRANVTSFAGALRCMDGLFRTFGAKNIAVVVEDIPDATQKVRAGAREMFTSATSAMTRGSRAVRLIPWVANSAVSAGREDVIKNASFAVQGSVSQFDETTLRKQRDGGICLGPLCLGAAESDAFSGMSLDLSLIELEGLTLLPGVTSKNYVLIRRKGKGFDGDLSLQKFGVQYNFTFTSSDGQGQALRALVELSAIELYGRLLKIPYWSCLGLSDADSAVALEIEDWWDTLRSDIPSLVSWLQIQMGARGLYKGDVDGQLSPELERAIRAYKQSLGLKADLNLDLEFFRKYLAADQQVLQKQAAVVLQQLESAESAAQAPVVASMAPPVPVAANPTAVAAATPSPGAAGVTLLNRKGPQHVHRRGEAVEVDVSVAAAGFLYCFLLDDQRQLTQFYPNPARPSSAVAPGTRIGFPGNFGFQILASKAGITETIACFRSPRDLGPDALGANKPVVRDIASLRQLLTQRAGGNLDMGVFDVVAR